MRFIFALVVALALPNAHSATSDDKPRVVFMGDSITEGWGSQPFFKNSRDFVNKGISGQTAGQMLARFSTDVIALEPRAVHILAGTNDVAENTGPETDEQIEGYISRMADLARAKGIKVILGSIPPSADFFWHTGLKPAPRIQRLNAWLRSYAEQQHLVYVDYWSALATAEGALKPEYGSDGVHPSAQGYAVMQPLAAAAIEKALGAR